jgi:hypothetical protein
MSDSMAFFPWSVSLCNIPQNSITKLEAIGTPEIDEPVLQLAHVAPPVLFERHAANDVRHSISCHDRSL